MESKPITKYIAELVGTFCLVLFGCGAAVIAGANTTDIPPSGIGLLGISLAFGISVVVMAYTIGPISGCHINPAISISMMVAGKLSVKDTVGYVLFQCIGAIAASGILYLLASGRSSFAMGEYALGANGWGTDYLGKYSTQSAFIGEAVFTFLFLIVIFGTTAKRANPAMAGLAVRLITHPDPPGTDTYNRYISESQHEALALQFLPVAKRLASYGFLSLPQYLAG